MKRKREVLALSIGLVLLSGIVLAQPAGEAPKPTAEHKKLGYFVGKWTSEGDLKPNPWMPGGRYSSTDTCEWFEGGFALLCRSEGKGPMGSTKSDGRQVDEGPVARGRNGDRSIFSVPSTQSPCP